jgi:uncharacterized ferredoxin-like protein
MIRKSREIEVRAVETVAELMCAAARTAPKGHGRDNLVTMIVKGATKQRLIEEMQKIAQESGASFFARDAAGVEKVEVVVLLGQKVKVMGVPNCGYCGYPNCAENQKQNGLCAISIGDLGIAIGSAVSVAGDCRIDNRIMFSIGRAALNLELFDDKEVMIAYGIPLSITGKNIFWDRG